MKLEVPIPKVCDFCGELLALRPKSVPQRNSAFSFSRLMANLNWSILDEKSNKELNFNSASTLP